MVISGARTVTAEGILTEDVRIEEGRIVETGPNLSGRRLEAEGKLLLPGMIDIGVRMRDGRLRGGTLQRMSAKARANGFGLLALSSGCTPRIDNEITLEFAKSQAKQCEIPVLPLLAGVTEAGGLSDCAILLKEGAVGIEFESRMDGNLIRRLMEYARLRNVTLFCRADDPALSGDGVMHEGAVSSALGLGGIPALAEYSQVARIGEFADAYGVNVVILGASTPRTVALCEQYTHLHAQLSWHHLLLDDTACEGYDTRAKLFPPLRDAEARRQMLEQLKNGQIAMLGSLHSPVSETAKDAVFAEAAFGIDGLSGAMAILYSLLIKPGLMTWPQWCRMCVDIPAKLLGLEGGESGWFLFDPDVLVEPEADSPYKNRALYGQVVPLRERDEG